MISRRTIARRLMVTTLVAASLYASLWVARGTEPANIAPSHAATRRSSLTLSPSTPQWSTITVGSRTFPCLIEDPANYRHWPHNVIPAGYYAWLTRNGNHLLVHVFTPACVETLPIDDNDPTAPDAYIP